MSAWQVRKRPEPRSGSGRRILSRRAEVKALTLGFSRTLGGTHGVARDNHDAILLAQQIERSDRL